MMVIPFVWMTKPSTAPTQRHDTTALITGLLLCIAALFPYWAFGQYSAVGWNDEFDLTIPWNIELTRQQPGESFNHSFAGGTGIAQASPAEHVSLLRTLLAIVPDWVAADIYRVLQLFLLFSGLYLTARKLFGAVPRAAFIGGVIGCFINSINYGWAIGGINWLYSVLAWAPLVLFNRGNLSARNIFLAFIFGCIAASATFPAFFLTGFFLLYLPLFWYFRIVDSGRVSLLPQICLLVAVMLPVVLNWSDLPHYLAQIGADSARMNGLGTLADVERFLQGTPTSSSGAFLSNMRDMLSWAFRYHNAVLLSIILFAYLQLKGSAYAKLVHAFGISILMLALLPYIGHLTDVAAIANYRWNQNFDNALIWASLLSSIAFSTHLTKAARHRPDSETTADIPARPCKILRIFERFSTTSVAYLLLVWAIVLMAYPHIYKSLYGLSVNGGWGVFSQYASLKSLHEDSEDFRVISRGYTPKASIAPAYGIDTFDGMRPNFSWRRSMFFKHAVLKNYAPPMHTSRQHIFNGVHLQDINFHALNMANVKYMLSDAIINIPFPNKRIFLAQAKTVSDVGGIAAHNSALSQQIVMPALVAYEIGEPWDRVFIPQNFSTSPFTNYQIGYYDQLASLPRNHVLIAKNDAEHMTAIGGNIGKVLSWNEAQDGLTIHLNGSPAQVVYNQEYSPAWTASCDNGLKLPITSANGIMMLISIPRGCKVAKFSISAE
ncbi:MAG: hypothetical protein PHH36_04500 [Sideroxydans sp.]|nr:hypothetical protein [Sideroxydans sp.]